MAELIFFFWLGGLVAWVAALNITGTLRARDIPMLCIWPLTLVVVGLGSIFRKQ